MNSFGVLYVVATPIGNRDDISRRALDLLKSVDLIAAEDTRHSQKLLQHYAIATRLLAYHDHASERQAAKIIAALESGLNVALISDAGTPLISDPGYRLVRELRQRGMQVCPVPGASALICALSAAGLPTDRFSFEGFLPAKSAARRQAFEKMRSSAHTSVFYESPHRILESLHDAVVILGADREAVLARELTKTYETFLGSTLGEISARVEADDNQRRGELVLMLRGVDPRSESDAELDAESERVLGLLLAELPPKKAAKLASQITGVPTKILYSKAVEL